MSISVKDLDPAFQGLSNKPGLDVWRLDQGQVVAVPKADHGKFFTKDAYIVLKTSGSKHGGAVTYAIHYWLGKSTTQDDAAMAAIKTVDLDAALGGKAAQYRETQGHESDLLLSYFRPCIIATPGSWGKPDPEASQPRLLQVKGRRFIHVRQVAVARSSLSHSEIFVLDTRSKLFQFTGANASKQERVKGMEVMQLLQDSVYGGKAPIAIIDDGKLDDPESNEFWDMFGGFAPIAKKSQGEDDVEVKPTPPTLYWVSGDGLQEVGAGALKKLQLEGNKCYLVDMGPTVFVWFGRISSLDERRAACIAAETQLVVGKKPPSVRVVRMPERFELTAFKACFSDWPVVPVLGGGEGGNKLKAMLKQSGVVDKAAPKGAAGGSDEHPPLAETPGDLKNCWSSTLPPILSSPSTSHPFISTPIALLTTPPLFPPLCPHSPTYYLALLLPPSPPFFPSSPPLLLSSSPSLFPTSPPPRPPPPLLRFSPPPGFPSSPPHILPSSPSPLLPSARLPACSSSPPLLLPPPLVLSALPPRLHQQAWRVAGSTKAAVAAEEVGKFHAGESYLVQHTSIRDRKHEYLLFLWLGKDTSAVSHPPASLCSARLSPSSPLGSMEIRPVARATPLLHCTPTIAPCSQSGCCALPVLCMPVTSMCFCLSQTTQQGQLSVINTPITPIASRSHRLSSPSATIALSPPIALPSLSPSHSSLTPPPPSCPPPPLSPPTLSAHSLPPTRRIARRPRRWRCGPWMGSEATSLW
ncbi:unnamed protein product [Closterium sp. NIES-64]|nr:unnamed protein product [Closterium sp. NIES-64]